MRDGTSKLAHDRPTDDGVRSSAQVLQFPPRERLRGRPFTGPPRPANQSNEPESGLIDELAQYEQDQVEANINYPQRMLMNAIAVAVVTLLIGVGVWLADTIADMERAQDCVLQGRQNCAPIEVSAPIQK